MSNPSLNLSQFPPSPIALIAGGTSGIGLGIARQLVLSRPDAQVTIAGRNVEAGESACRDANEVISKAGKTGGGKMSFKRLDASLMRDVRSFAEEYASQLKSQSTKPESYSQVDLLILSQGQLTLSRELTSEGLLVTIALNYYSRFFLLRELIRLDILSPTAIIVFVLNARAGDSTGGKIIWDDMDLTARGGEGRSAAIWKAIPHNFGMVDVMLQAVAKEDPLETRTYIHDYPGFVETDLMKKSDFPWIIKQITKLTSMLKSTLTIDQAGSYILSGSLACAKKTANVTEKKESEKKAKTWYYMVEDGSVIEKPEASEEVTRKVKEHTWRLLDEALEGEVKTHC